jgi:hypothetical protein
VAADPVRSVWEQVARRDTFAERCAADGTTPNGEGKGTRELASSASAGSSS